MRRRLAGSPVTIVLLAAALLLLREAIAQSSNPEDCAPREAIAARLMKLESAKPVVENLSVLYAEIALIKREVANLQPVMFGTCPNLGIADLEARIAKVRGPIDDVQRAVADENARQQRRAEEQAEQERRRLERDRLRQAEERRRREIGAKPWPDEIKQAVVERRVQIGMTSEQVTAAWGRPEKVNETITATRRDEQWVYGDSYLYFTNGKLIAIQRTR